LQTLKKLLYTLLLFTAPVECIAQPIPDLKFRHLNISNGLPGNKIFFSYKDSKNLLWIATSAGLIRYDGIHYKVYAERKGNNTGFYGNSIAKIIEDSLGNLYIGNERGINYYERSKEQFTHIFYKQDSKGKEFITPQYVDENNKLWFFSSSAGKLVSYDLKTKEYRENPADCMERLIPFPAVLYKSLQIIVSINLVNGIRVFTCKSGEPVSHKDYFTKAGNNYPQAIISHKLYIQDTQNLWLPSNLGLIWLNPYAQKFSIHHDFEKKEIGTVTCVTSFTEKYLLVGTSVNGIFIFDRILGKFIKNIRHTESDPASLSSNAISDIQCDKEKNIFITIYGRGIDIASWPNPAVLQSFSQQSTQPFNTSNNLKFISRIRDSLFWCVNQENKILQWNALSNAVSEPVFLKKFNLSNNGQTINQLYSDKDKKTWIVTNNTLYYKTLSDNTLHPIPVEASAKRIIMLNKGRYLFTSHRSLFLLTDETPEWHIREITELVKEKLSAHSTILMDSIEGKIYLLSEWGQVISQLKEFSDSFRLIKKSAWSNTPCTESYSYNDNQFILLPGANGLLQFNKNDFSFKKRCEGEVADNELASLVQYNDSIFFVLSVNSILKIRLPGWVSSKVNLPFPDALKKNLFYQSLYCDGKFVYAATSDGIIQYNPGLVPGKNDKPDIYFSSVVAYKEKDSFYEAPQYKETILVSPNARGLSIFLSNLNFASGNSLDAVQYQLVNYHTNPQQIDENGRIYINKLAPGKYFLKIISKNDGSVLKQIIIIWQPYWYQAKWLKVVLLLIVTFGAIAVYRSRIRQIREKIKLRSDYENKMLHLEMQNLRSQMNPHFIFNSLNSINSFIVENKTHLASDYLTKFSRLIRLILDNSKNESILLEKELETLKLYLLMESLRFDKKFDYFVYTEPDIDGQLIKVPPMIIQPYVENAIWHGLLHKNEKGKVHVHLKKIHQALQIIIEDNGIGRVKAAAMKSKNIEGTKSYGMQITALRIEQLNRKNEVETIDLTDEQGNASGTRVTVTIYIDA
jgi:hypothetical protein